MCVFIPYIELPDEFRQFITMSEKDFPKKLICQETIFPLSV